MEKEEMRRLWIRPNEFCVQFDDCIEDCRTRKHLRTYVGGRLSSLERKSVELIALEMGTPA